MLTRALGHDHDARFLLAVNGLVGAPVLSSLMLFVGVWPTPLEWLALAAIGLFSGFAHLLVIHAYKLAPASLLAPFQYLEITGAVALGLLVFGDFPDLLTWVGTGDHRRRRPLRLLPRGRAGALGRHRPPRRESRAATPDRASCGSARYTCAGIDGETAR